MTDHAKQLYEMYYGEAKDESAGKEYEIYWKTVNRLAKVFQQSLVSHKTERENAEPAKKRNFDEDMKKLISVMEQALKLIKEQLPA